MSKIRPILTFRFVCCNVFKAKIIVRCVVGSNSRKQAFRFNVLYSSHSLLVLYCCCLWRDVDYFCAFRVCHCATILALFMLLLSSSCCVINNAPPHPKYMLVEKKLLFDVVCVVLMLLSSVYVFVLKQRRRNVVKCKT